METTGCGTALITPFLEDGSLDSPSLTSLVNWQVASGINFLVVCGSTGEAATLDEPEWLQAISIVVEATRGRVPVYAGCTHNSTHTLLRQAAKLHRTGIDGVLSASPYYNQPSQEGQFHHFAALASAVAPLPVILYNVPGRTGVNLAPETVLRLAQAHPNIQAVKEASGNLAQLAELVRILPPDFKIFSGDDNIALPAIEAGASGLISVASNEIPAELTRLVQAALHHDWPTARQLEQKYMPLFLANFWESNPAPVKTILNRMGRCTPTLRLPLVPPTPVVQHKLELLATDLGLIP